MYIEKVPNRGSPPAVLLRESWREGGRTVKRTIANLSSCPPKAVEAFRLALKGIELVPRQFSVTVTRAHRRNFNRPFNPFVLLVSRVGEEGIDLQEQCRYVIHYDLEWNPAKMEQREGRVDRVGWGRADEGFIDVRFKLLKGTYE